MLPVLKIQLLIFHQGLTDDSILAIYLAAVPGDLRLGQGLWLDVVIHSELHLDFKTDKDMKNSAYKAD